MKSLHSKKRLETEHPCSGPAHTEPRDSVILQHTGSKPPRTEIQRRMSQLIALVTYDRMNYDSTTGSSSHWFLMSPKLQPGTEACFVSQLSLQVLNGDFLSMLWKS